MCYEIAKVLGYDCARIELAKDTEGVLGVLNYFFVDSNTKNNILHMDAVVYLKKDNEERSSFYSLSNIKSRLDALDENLFYEFIRIMVFDALVGEQDRHEENWGVQIIDNQYRISPLYDNGCSLLREFKNEQFARKYYTGKNPFDAYIKRSRTLIYKEGTNKKYKHFELVEYLLNNYPNIVEKEILNLNKLTDNVIVEIVEKIPDDLITEMHKKFIIEYLKIRRDILLNMNKGDYDEKWNVANLEATNNKKKI